MAIVFLVLSCQEKEKPLFKILDAQRTGITFNNRILEDEYFNILSDEYIYNGAGLAVGDFNLDGLQDIYFCGGMVSNKLYLNQGDFTFSDVSRESQTEADEIWSTGVTVVDLNKDNWPDLYVCASNKSDSLQRKNRLFINQGLNDSGIPVFTEEAEKYGIADDGFSTHGVFFDYDKDGDLDLYVLTNVLDIPNPNTYKPRKTDGSATNNDRFYRNENNRFFTDITREAGIVYEGYGLGISIVDINLDGWSDIYITNDYLTNDLLYINNQDGTFSNKIDRYLKHQTHSAMGHDIADVNNDGWIDIFTLDMFPESNQLMKQMHATSRFENNELNERYGYQYQYKRNMLHVNNGPDGLGNHNFSEIGLYAGVYATDWSWSALLADYDNDGYRDLFISNGYPRDVTDLDFATTTGLGKGMTFSQEEILMTIPKRHHSNYIFRNNGDLTFTDKTKKWGIEKLSFSNGGTYCDFDNDGDLDIVLNNINEPALVYENLLYKTGKEKTDKPHFLRINLKTGENLVSATGTKIYLYTEGGKMLYEDYSLTHGFTSSREPVVHFGLGKSETADSLIIIWPEGSAEKIENIRANQVVEIEYKKRDKTPSNAVVPQKRSVNDHIFLHASGKYSLQYLHREKIFDDFRLQPTLPFQLSKSGPPLAVGDLNGDDRDDLVIGSSIGNPLKIYINERNGFREAQNSGLDENFENLGILIFDADQDGKNDLYLVAGGNERTYNSREYQDKFYHNQGNGKFELLQNALPASTISGGCVKAVDFDRDGDLDLFVGGKTIPGRYPDPTSSSILENRSEPGNPEFINITKKICPDLIDLGLVKDALWTDFDNDNLIDLIIVGEWMPITLFRNTGSGFINITPGSGLDELTGWWNSLAGGDFDNDGDIDYIAGNQGLNTIFTASSEKPVEAFSADFDNNGRYDLILTTYYPDINGGEKRFPIHLRSDIFNQMDMLKDRFPTYESYSEATLDSVLTESELAGAGTLKATKMESVYIRNLGEGKFEASPLPKEAQLAPVYGILPGDFNEDQLLDVLLVGNEYGNNVFWGRQDALNGLLLEGKGDGSFIPHSYTETGFLVDKDAKALVLLEGDNGKPLIISSQNQDSLKVFEADLKARTLPVKAGDAWGILELEDGKNRKQEFYYGNSYLSQSSRILWIPAGSKSSAIYDIKGNISIAVD